MLRMDLRVISVASLFEISKTLADTEIIHLSIHVKDSVALLAQDRSNGCYFLPERLVKPQR